MKKKYRLWLEDLVSNLFVILMENDCNVDCISYEQILYFGKIICKEAEKKDIEVVLNLNRELTQKFLREYSKVFIEIETENNQKIKLNDGITLVQLISDFRGYLPLDLLLIVENEEISHDILDMMGYNKTDKPKLKTYIRG